MKKILSIVASVAMLGLVWHFAPLGQNQIVHAQQFADCVSSAAAPSCASAATGHVTIAAGATTVVVGTTAVAAGSEIFISRDDTQGTLLGVTCNTATVTGEIKTSARVAGTSFTITVQTTPAVNPGCYTFNIVNRN